MCSIAGRTVGSRWCRSPNLSSKMGPVKTAHLIMKCATKHFAQILRFERLPPRNRKVEGQRQDLSAGPRTLVVGSKRVARGMCPQNRFSSGLRSGSVWGGYSTDGCTSRCSDAQDLPVTCLPSTGSVRVPTLDRPRSCFNLRARPILFCRDHPRVIRPRIRHRTTGTLRQRTRRPASVGIASVTPTLPRAEDS